MFDAAQRFFWYGWQHSPTGALIVQLNRSRMNFRQHPLYRRWSDAAYEHRLAYLAESVPGHVAQFLPVALLFGPFLPFVVVIIFGASVFNAFLIALLIFLIAVALLIASADGMLAAGLTAGSLNQERESGRWELLMLIPEDRMSVVIMRVSSMLMPYRPLVGTMDFLQTVAAFIAALILSGRATETDSNLLGLCMLFFLPSLLLLGWERPAGLRPEREHRCLCGLDAARPSGAGVGPQQWGGDCLCAAGGGDGRGGGGPDGTWLLGGAASEHRRACHAAHDGRANCRFRADFDCILWRARTHHPQIPAGCLSARYGLDLTEMGHISQISLG